MTEEELKQEVLELADGLYPINEETKVVILERRRVSIAVGNGAVALKLEDKLAGYDAQYLPETNTIYIVLARGKWIKTAASGYQRWEA